MNKAFVVIGGIGVAAARIAHQSYRETGCLIK
jgi:hypothetical protein